MEFNYIINPESGKKVSIYGNTGKKVLGNYIKFLHKHGGNKISRKISKKKKKYSKKRKTSKGQKNNKKKYGGSKNTKQSWMTKTPEKINKTGIGTPEMVMEANKAFRSSRFPDTISKTLYPSSGTPSDSNISRWSSRHTPRWRQQRYERRTTSRNYNDHWKSLETEDQWKLLKDLKIIDEDLYNNTIKDDLDHMGIAVVHHNYSFITDKMIIDLFQKYKIETVSEDFMETLLEQQQREEKMAEQQRKEARQQLLEQAKARELLRRESRRHARYQLQRTSARTRKPLTKARRIVKK